MKDYMKTLTLICILALSVIGQAPVSAQSITEQVKQSRISQKDHGLKTSQDAIADPFNDDKVKAYMALLPKDDNLYVVEGDLLLTEQELHAYLVIKSQSEKPVDSSAELIVNVHNGQRDYYLDAARRTLSYAVDRQSFPNEERYNEAVENMRIATSDWEAVCPECKIKFDYQKASDLNPSTEKVNFVVRFHDVGGAYIAAAFFPHDPSVRRYLNLDPSYFKTTFNKAGVLRHELGHVLGYRHEHIRGIVGCFYEDNNWQPLTDYDPKSVMHYYCGGGGGLNLDLTDVDKNGHRKLYGSTAIGLTAIPTLRVRFEGPELSKSLPAVLEVLSKAGLIEGKQYTVKTNQETVTSIYAATLKLPDSVISSSMISYANNLNKGTLKKKLDAGQEILFPDVAFKTFQKVVVLNPKEKEDLITYNKIWGTWPAPLIKENRQAVGSDLISLSLKGYELNLQLTSAEEDTQARTVLKNLRRTSKANYLVLAAPLKSRGPAALFSFRGETLPGVNSPFATAGPLPTPSPDPACSSPVPSVSADEFYSRVLRCPEGLALGVEGDLRQVLGPIDDMQFPNHCTTNCPEVVLMDNPVAKHPDIVEAIVYGAVGAPGDAPISDNKQRIRIADNILEQQHGTYMAGIIASRSNGFGLIGVDPKASIVSFNWDLEKDNPQNVADEINNRRTNADVTNKMQIFVFATEWEFKLPYDPKKRLDNETDLDDQDAWREVAKAIEDGKPLVIAAAGQPKTTGAPREELDYTIHEGPRNLGDMPNVIVVTAYQVENGKRLLWSSANYLKPNALEKIVHVAAPGLDILSTIPNSGSDSAAPYVRASGTSQATAFVAGVVSAMVSAWPTYYRLDAALVKTRLQVTSDPFFKATEANQLAAGIIDYNLAMHDPSQDWFKASGSSTFLPVSFSGWKVNEIQLIDSLGRPLGLPVKTKKIVRLMFRGGDCYIYTSIKRGKIQKFGPGKLRQADLTGLQLFELKQSPDGAVTPYSLSEISDLVLALPYCARAQPGVGDNACR